MNGLPYYKRFPRDLIEGTVSMPFELKGAYSLILDLIYLHNGKLPDDARYIAGQLNVSVRKWNSMRSELVSRDKLKIIGEFLTNLRAVTELESLTKLQDKQAENRARPNKNNDLQSPKPNHTEPEPDKVIRIAKSDLDDDPVAEPVAVGQTVVEIMGVAKDPRWLGNYSLASGWLAEGFDPDLDIYPVVRAICDRKREQGQNMPYSLKYFTNAIRSHHAQRMDGTQPTRYSDSQLITLERGSPEFDAWISHFQKQGQRTGFRASQPVMTVPSKLPPTADSEVA